MPASSISLSRRAESNGMVDDALTGAFMSILRSVGRGSSQQSSEAGGPAKAPDRAVLPCPPALDSGFALMGAPRNDRKSGQLIERFASVASFFQVSYWRDTSAFISSGVVARGSPPIA